jgi:hypothetical protein
MTKRKPKIGLTPEDVRVTMERMVKAGFAYRVREDGKFKYALTERGLTASNKELAALETGHPAGKRDPWDEVACLCSTYSFLFEEVASVAVNAYTRNLGWPPPSDAALADVKAAISELVADWYETATAKPAAEAAHQ